MLTFGVLSDADIAHRIGSKRIRISPWRPEKLKPASVDVTLSKEFLRFNTRGLPFIDPLNLPDNLTTPVTVEKTILVKPGEFLLGSTNEYLEVPEDLVCCLHGKSTIARCGLLVHITAGWIDPGFAGNITLELYNVQKVPILLTPGMDIGQVQYTTLTTKAANPYGSRRLRSRYHRQQGPTGPKVRVAEVDKS